MQPEKLCAADSRQTVSRRRTHPVIHALFSRSFSARFRMDCVFVSKKARGFWFSLMFFLLKVQKRTVFFVKKIKSWGFSGLKKQKELV